MTEQEVVEVGEVMDQLPLHLSPWEWKPEAECMRREHPEEPVKLVLPTHGYRITENECIVFTYQCPECKQIYEAKRMSCGWRPEPYCGKNKCVEVGRRAGFWNKETGK